MSICVNLRLPEGVIKKIDSVVKAGDYKSRAQFCEIAVYSVIREIYPHRRREEI